MKKIIKDDEILKVITEILLPFILVMGIYVVLNGHLSPGGGFSGGTILGSGLILYSTAFGSEKIRKFFNFNTFIKAISFSLLFYGVAKGYSFMTGAAHIESVIPTGTPGKILSGGLILPLNIAVGIVVACTMYGLYSLFSEGDI
ncbi:MnhB domain-containing protein [Tissierella sp. Yu-01]|uniref:MnhB domain-containing protein n=1 Tax=Tissierella sp. Yu-01 TaxID=3035694 RepID=UPI00240D388E|nr:MnhB domain-containing protein [Tissierella sp. Yu-01]WFA08472.1 MnhB domain-containing protein [Tissierella sp. Yu-01]